MQCSEVGGQMSILVWGKCKRTLALVLYIDREGKAILPAYWVEAVVENYNLVCLQNGCVFGTTYSSELDLTIT